MMETVILTKDENENESGEHQSENGEEMAEAEDMIILEWGDEFVCFPKRPQHDSS